MSQPCFAGELLKRDLAMLSGADAASNRQTQLIMVAERLLQEYYTRISQDPSTLPALYLDNAEVIYTGKELNVDAALMAGKEEITEFFSCKIARRFKSARVMVDAIHPLASPLSSFGLVLFAKGRIWLQSPKTGAFTVSAFFHFLCMAPQPKFATWNTPPQYFIANEYFHIADLSLCGEENIKPSPNVTPEAADPSLQTDENTVITSSAPIAPAGSLGDTSMKQSTANYGGRQITSLSAIAGSKTKDSHPRDQESTLHAQPASPIEVKDDEELREIISDLVKKTEGCDKGSCLGISRPRFAPSKAFFFIQFDSQKTAQRMRQIGKIELKTVTVQLSPVRTRQPNSLFRYGSQRGNAKITSKASFENVTASSTEKTAAAATTASTNEENGRLIALSNNSDSNAHNASSTNNQRNYFHRNFESRGNSTFASWSANRRGANKSKKHQRPASANKSAVSATIENQSTSPAC